MKKTINLFLIGPGLVGGSFLKYIAQIPPHYFNKMSLKLNLVGLGNSKKMIFNEKGITLSSWKNKLERSDQKMVLKSFIERMKKLELVNSIFLDCTAGEVVVPYYKDIFASSISIVTPNKLANSGSYSKYINLQTTAKKYSVDFRYSANVGVGLPTIDIIRNLREGGDEIYIIEGLFSSSMNFILNEFMSRKIAFSEIVHEAKEKGLTEPDPREDLNGLDVARKLLILAREAGARLELTDIEVENLVPTVTGSAKSADEFLIKLSNVDKRFDKWRTKVIASGKTICYLAKYHKGKAFVKLVPINSSHPFYDVSSKEKIVSFTTKFYTSSPLIIKGKSGGADATAAVILSDIMKISQRGI